MCCSRTSSSCCDILVLGLSHDAVAEVSAQRAGRVQVHAAPENGRELLLQVEEGKTRDVAGLELDQDVYVALRPEVVAQDGAEECQAPDMMAPAKVGDAILVDGDAGSHGVHGTR